MNISYAWIAFHSNPGFKRYLSLFRCEKEALRAFMALYAEAFEVLPALKKRMRYSCELLCGPILWRRHPSKGQRRALGIALKHLVNVGALPLVCVTPTQNNKFYTIKE